MTWERFEQTGAVEDYLQYKGVDWRTSGQQGGSRTENRKAGEAAEHGTIDHGDGHGAGRASV